jgi:hypothetical protein
MPETLENICNIQIYFCNIQMKHLKQTSKTSETLNTVSSAATFYLVENYGSLQARVRGMSTAQCTPRRRRRPPPGIGAGLLASPSTMGEVDGGTGKEHRAAWDGDGCGATALEKTTASDLVLEKRAALFF